MKRWFLPLLAVLLLINTGCGPSDPMVSDAPSSAPTASGDVPTYAGSTDFDWDRYRDVRITIMWQATDSTQESIVEDFAKPAVAAVADQCGLKVRWVENPNSNYASLAASGQLADIWFSNVSMDMIEAGILLDLTPYLSVDSYLADMYRYPELNVFRDRIWALSSGVDSFYNGVLYYNTEQFEKAYVESIDTYDKFLDSCLDLHDEGYGGLVLDFGRNSVYSRFLWQNTVISEDPDVYRALLAGDPDAFLNPAFEGAFAQYRTLCDDGLLTVLPMDDAVAAFLQGSCSMIYVDSWKNADIWLEITKAETAEDVDIPEIGVAWWPSNNPDYPTGSYIAGWGSPLSGWCAKADTEYPELAVELIKVIVSAEAARHLAFGLETNHVQDGVPVPVNALEARRCELRATVGEFLPGWQQNTVDAETFYTFCEIMAQVGDPEQDVDLPELVSEMDVAWRSNTFFD